MKKAKTPGTASFGHYRLGPPETFGNKPRRSVPKNPTSDQRTRQQKKRERIKQRSTQSPQLPSGCARSIRRPFVDRVGNCTMRSINWCRNCGRVLQVASAKAFPAVLWLRTLACLAAAGFSTRLRCRRPTTLTHFGSLFDTSCRPAASVSVSWRFSSLCKKDNPLPPLSVTRELGNPKPTKKSEDKNAAYFLAR